MKKVLLLLLVAIALISFSACSCSKKKVKNELEELAKTGNPEHIYNLGEYYWENRGSNYFSDNNKNHKKASELYLQAAEKGYHPAMRTYATRQGDDYVAYTWLNLAGAFCPENERVPIHSQRDEYREKLSKEQIAKSQDEALKIYEKITGITLYDPSSPK